MANPVLNLPFDLSPVSVERVLAWLSRGTATLSLDEHRPRFRRWQAVVSEHNTIIGEGENPRLAALDLIEGLRVREEATVRSGKLTTLPLSENLRAAMDDRSTRMHAVYSNLGGDWTKAR